MWTEYPVRLIGIHRPNIIRLTAISKNENGIEIYYRKKRSEGNIITQP